MARVIALILAAGQGKRMAGAVPKQFLVVAGRPLVAHTLAKFQEHPQIDEIIVVTRAEDIAYCWQKIVAPFGLTKVSQIIAGGDERGASVYAGLLALPPEAAWVLIHDGVRPLVSAPIIADVLRAAQENGAAIAAVPVKDTIKMVAENSRVAKTLVREKLWQAQTPQGFKKDLIIEAYRQAHHSGRKGTDDASLVEQLGVPVTIVRGEDANLKITTPDDLLSWRGVLSGGRAEGLGGNMRVGFGYDVHPWAAGRKLILGGVEIPFNLGLAGHSDADVLTHALMDALLGAAALGDIGDLFPASEAAYRDASSLLLLKQVVDKVQKLGYFCLNVDCTLAAERPPLAPYREMMCQNLAAALGIARERVNIKFTTTEGLGFVGRQEGVAAQVCCLMEKMSLAARVLEEDVD